MINGIILLDKPKGMSSNSAANFVKKIVGANKAGHLGTLDVAGHGLLPITLGKSTKLFDYFLEKDKVYQASFLFGKETDTFDLEGQVVKEEKVNITIDDINKVIPNLIGKQLQLPPKYSAKKIKGKKAYDLARLGIEVDLKPKEIEIYDLNVLKQISENEFLFEIHCSSGTYIRSLCRDLASLLSTCGVMTDIIRTKCGNFELKKAYTIEQIQCNRYEIISPHLVFDYEEIHLNDQQEMQVLNGIKIDVNEKDGLYKVFGNEFIGLGKVNKGYLTIKIRLI